MILHDYSVRSQTCSQVIPPLEILSNVALTEEHLAARAMTPKLKFAPRGPCPDCVRMKLPHTRNVIHRHHTLHRRVPSWPASWPWCPISHAISPLLVNNIIYYYNNILWKILQPHELDIPYLHSGSRRWPTPINNWSRNVSLVVRKGGK